MALGEGGEGVICTFGTALSKPDEEAGAETDAPPALVACCFWSHYEACPRVAVDLLGDVPYSYKDERLL